MEYTGTDWVNALADPGIDREVAGKLLSRCDELVSPDAAATIGKMFASLEIPAANFEPAFQRLKDDPATGTPGLLNRAFKAKPENRREGEAEPPPAATPARPKKPRPTGPAWAHRFVEEGRAMRQEEKAPWRDRLRATAESIGVDADARVRQIGGGNPRELAGTEWQKRHLETIKGA